MTKKMINTTVMHCSPYDFEGPLSTLKENVQAWIDSHGPDAEFRYDRNFFYAYDTEPTPSLLLTKSRLETDTEYADRTAQAAARQAEQDERDRREFERLRAKFNQEGN